ncbi:aminotransferase class V-fold PLP-dependent enzyme [Paraglaciecola sp. 20A4]|uniref:aminotransferase class V-fold PLP-dependent enzyme n=1 Tax=Paraglaciecola sp. 20A4 TaxID=2687288 RepID=UPI001409979D|nr:aminotransferase class V-fold PLP-dependent enzyme [Paraglaciecola sp. 20A4]
MSEDATNFERRTILKTLTAGAVCSLAMSGLAHSTPHVGLTEFPVIPKNASAASLAKDESFWAKVALFYDTAQGIVNLEHGYWGKMSRPVQEAFIEKTRMVNTDLSYYARKHYGEDHKLSARKVAEALGAREDEVALTRNATESIHNLIRQYNKLEPNDAILYTDIDYPSFKDTMQWLATSRNLDAVEVKLPPQANQQQILDKYIEAFDKHTNLKLMLLTHVSNQHGLILPVAKISAIAKLRGIDVICDCAQSWGLIDFNITELNVDWAGFNLHKWIGSPVGVGALYMKNGSLKKVSAYPGESDPKNASVNARVHTATVNFAAILTLPAALDFHHMIGGANKEARLRYLHSLWANEARNMPHIEVLGGSDEGSSTGMGAFRLVGKATLEDATQLQQRLEYEFGVFTVVRVGLSSGCCIRVTPQVFTSASDISQLVTALKNLG